MDGDSAESWPDPAVILAPNFEIGPNMNDIITAICHAQQAIIHGLRKGTPKTVNFHRVHQILQEPKESPTNFLNRLKDGFQRFTDLDPDLPAN